MRKYAVLIAAILAISPLTSEAVPIDYKLTLESGANTYVGGFSIDDSLLLPNSFITFSNFISFDITVEGLNFVLANAFRPDFEGVLTDGSGEAVQFDDPQGNFAEFYSGPGGQFPVLAFADGTFNFQFTGGNLDGTYYISRVPEPGTLALLGIGLLGIGAARRRVTA